MLNDPEFNDIDYSYFEFLVLILSQFVNICFRDVLAIVVLFHLINIKNLICPIIDYLFNKARF